MILSLSMSSRIYFWNLIPQIDSYTLKLVQSDKSLMHVFTIFFSTFEKIILTKESNSDV